MKKIIAFVLLATLTLTLMGACASSPSAKTTKPPTPSESTASEELTDDGTEELTDDVVEPEEPPSATINNIGDTVTLNDWEITMVSCDVRSQIKSSEYFGFTADEGNQYVVVTLNIKNCGTSSDAFLASYSIGDTIKAKLTYQGKYEFSSTNLIGYDEDLHNKNLNPLSSAEGAVVFEIAEEAAQLADLVFTLSAGKESIGFTCQS